MDSSTYFNSKKIMMLKSNDLIVNFYQYLGIDPLYPSFKKNPLLRKMDKVTDNTIIGKYNSPDDQSKFNGKHIQLTLGNNKNLQKAFQFTFTYYKNLLIN